jgi:hypothetical protein
MQIQRGKLYENKTWRYLYPCLKFYGEELMKNLGSFFKLAVGVRDFNRKDEPNCLYILIDTNIPLASDSQIRDYKERFSKFLDWLSYQEYYVSDYIYEKDMHMLVLRIPKEYSSTYINFTKGQYSKMYSLKDIRDYFKYLQIPNKELELKQNGKLKIIKDVLNKEKSYIKTFVDIVNKEFKTTASVNDFIEAELDFPPKKEEEIFNYEVVKEAVKPL